MSRSAWAGLLLTGAGLGLVAWFLFRGLPEDVRTDAENARAQIALGKQTVAESRAELDAVIAKDPDYLKGLPDVAQARATLDAKEEALAGLERRLGDEIDPLLASNDHDDAPRLAELTGALAGDLGQALRGIHEPIAQIETLLGYKTNHAELIAAARSRIEAARAVSADEVLGQSVQRAATAWPEAADKLKAREAALREQVLQVVQGDAQLLGLLARAPPDYVATGRLAESIAAAGAGLDGLRAKLSADLAALSRSVDRELVDMKRGGGKSWHKYRVIEDGVAHETDWVEVTPTAYAQHTDHLGMTIFSKPAGVLPEDATELAAPTGYTYVGNPRYGRWEARGGQSFWVFYGRYALLRDGLWGPGRYSPIARRDWDGYRGSRSAGRAWYGSKSEFGTRGSSTRTRYANSSFYRTQQRARAAPKSAPKKGYSGSKYSSSGSRGGSFRTSRYRSSSRSGGGK